MFFKRGNLLIFFIAIFCSQTVLGLDESDRALLERAGLLQGKLMLHTDVWSVKPSKIDIDKVTYHGQAKSLINWDNLEEKKWLDFHYWKQQRLQRDMDPGWKIKLRDSAHVEKIGKVIKCIGECKLYRGEKFANAQYRSQLVEGDEFITSDDSFAWLCFADGSLLRISPNTSITLNEINISKNNFLYYLRLNHGHVHWQVRTLGKYKVQNMAESDLIFQPFMKKEANREHYSRLEYQKLGYEEKMLYELEKNKGHKSQYEQLNKLLAENIETIKKINTTVFLTAPNATYIVKNSHFDTYYSINGRGHFRFKDVMEGMEKEDSRQSGVTALFRGYTNRKEEKLEKSIWYEINKSGLKLSAIEEDLKQYRPMELFVNRTPTIHLIREFFMRESFPFIFDSNITMEKMAQQYGYRLWDSVASDEIEERLIFLKEYTRRVETTNLRSMVKVFSDLDEIPFNVSFYRKALNKHIFGLKKLSHKKRSIIPEMNEVQYYIWTLKYAQ